MAWDSIPQLPYKARTGMNLLESLNKHSIAHPTLKPGSLLRGFLSTSRCKLLEFRYIKDLTVDTLKQNFYRNMKHPG